ncbi:MAG: hypothetical protein U0232_03915 [Thermomicrobiales bacterium]
MMGIHRRVRVVGHEARVGVNSTRRQAVGTVGLFGAGKGARRGSR